MANHEPTSCYLCEPVPAESYRRHWKHEAKTGYWHVIADGPELMARLPRQAHFVTVLSYRPTAEGLPGHYRGALFFEFDGEQPAQAFVELRQCLELLMTEYDCPAEAIHVWHLEPDSNINALDGAVVTGEPLDSIRLGNAVSPGASLQAKGNRR